MVHGFNESSCRPPLRSRSGVKLPLPLFPHRERNFFFFYRNDAIVTIIYYSTLVSFNSFFPFYYNFIDRHLFFLRYIFIEDSMFLRYLKLIFVVIIIQ